jgi:hypothetical protein
MEAPTSSETLVTIFTIITVRTTNLAYTVPETSIKVYVDCYVVIRKPPVSLWEQESLEISLKTQNLSSVRLPCQGMTNP